MTDSENNQEAAVFSPQDAEEAVRSFGLIFSNTFLYGVEHGVTEKAVKECYDLIVKLLQAFPELDFTVTDDELMVNDQAVELKNPLLRMFVTHLEEREVSGFGIQRGMDEATFRNLLEVFSAKPDELKQLGGFAQALKTLGIQYVRSKQVVYKQVAEDEVIVSKDAVVDYGRRTGLTAEELVSFLKGEDSEGGAECSDAIQEAMADPDAMGTMLIDAAQEEKGAGEGGATGGEEEESLAEAVGMCLQRGFEAIQNHPANKTQKGKKKLTKALMLLEKSLLEKLKEALEEKFTDEDEAKLQESIESMVDELKIDALASEYMKKRSAMDTNEQKILRFIKTKGAGAIEDSELKERLLAGGLTEESWHELMLKSGVGGGDGSADGLGGSGGLGFGGGGGSLEAIGQLALLLANMEETVSAESGAEGDESEEKKELDTEKLTATLKEVDKEVDTIVAKTEAQLAQLAEEMKQDQGAVDAMEAEAVKQGNAPRLTRRRLMEILKEIGQELCQPLSVIDCSLDMIMSKSLGEISEPQSDMLKLAAESSVKLKMLVDDLIEIAGLPATMRPDQDIQTALYE